MKKILFSLGGVITSFAAVPFVAASCSKESEQKKERKVVVADLNDKSKKAGDKVDKHEKVTYLDLGESINLDGITVDIDWSMFKSGNFIVSKYKKEGAIGQIFISTYKGKTTIHGKSNTNKPFEGVPLGTITGLPKNFSITNAENPIYKEGKSSGFIDLFKEGDKIKFKFRFHRYNGQSTDPNISTQVFEATIE